MDAIEEIIARDRAALAKSDYDQAHSEEILDEMRRKYGDDYLLGPSWPLWIASVAVVLLAAYALFA